VDEGTRFVLASWFTLCPGPPGAVTRPQRSPPVNQNCMALLCGRVRRLTSKTGGSRPRRAAPEHGTAVCSSVPVAAATPAEQGAVGMAEAQAQVASLGATLPFCTVAGCHCLPFLRSCYHCCNFLPQ
jgi:hypothetical protein